MTLDHIAEEALIDISRAQRAAAQALGVPLVITVRGKDKAK